MPVIAQEKPSWVNPINRTNSYPETSHFIGFASRYFEKGEDLNEVQEKVMGQARTALSEYIDVQVTSEATSKLKNSDGEARESYSKSIATSSSLKTGGLKTEVYVDVRKNIAYAMAVVPKKKLIASYYLLLSEEMKSVKRSLESASRISDKGRAYAIYLDIIQKLESLKSMQYILRTLGTTNDVVLQTATWKQYFEEADTKSEELRNTDDIGLQEAAHFLTDKLIQELDNRDATIVLGMLGYKATSMGSEFSHQFKQLIIQNFREKGIKISESTQRGGVQYLLSGSYWPGKTKIQVSAEITEQHDAEMIRLVAGGTVFIPTSRLVDEEINIEPLNFKTAQETTQTIESGRQLEEGLSLEFWTNQPGDAALFTEGDVLSLSVRVNRPSYIRLFNIWKDGTILLLLDNYAINTNNTNLIVSVSQEFMTQCPCGVEHLQMMAQTEPFTELDTYQKEGFDFVKEDLRSALDKSRGFGKKKDEDYGFAEKTIIVTTIKK